MQFFLASNPIFQAYLESDLFGKIIFLSLAFLSILTWTLFLQKWRLQQKVMREGKNFQQSFQKKRTHPLNLEFTVPLCYCFDEIYRNLKQQTLELLNKNRRSVDQRVFLSRSDIELIQAQLMTTISQESKKLEKHLFILSTTASLAPFLGLLGTVWGILLTFAELQTKTMANSNATIMGGLSMALGTTVLGLLVAIPALISYNYLKSSAHHLTTDMEDFSHLLLASVELQYRKVET